MVPGVLEEVFNGFVVSRGSGALGGFSLASKFPGSLQICLEIRSQGSLRRFQGF